MQSGSPREETLGESYSSGSGRLVIGYLACAVPMRLAGCKTLTTTLR